MWFFDCFVGADQIELQRRKPQPDVYIEALNQLGIDADRALAFEDSPAGITAAKSAKITTVAVSNFLTRHLDLSAADKVLGSMAELTLTELVTEFNERKKMNKLQQLKAYTTVVADTGDIDAISAFTPEDATTNPSLVLKAAEMPQYDHLIEQAVGWAKEQSDKPEQQVIDAADKLAVNIGLEI